MFPFTRFDGYLKCVRLDDLTPGQFDFIKTLFAEFFSAPQHASAKRDAAQEAGLPMDPVFHYRRFSGSADLPRGRYFTVCHSDAGDSGQTLALELLAYANQNCRGLVNVIDLAGLEDSDRDAYAQRFNHPLPRHALLIQFAPFGRHRETGDEVLASSIGPVVQIVPYSIERVAIDRTLDLLL